MTALRRLSRPLAALLLALSASVLPTAVVAAEKLTVMLDWFVNPDHGPLFVARELGYFEQAGLEIELIAPADPNNPPKLVAAGKADIAVSYQPSLHMQVDQGLPLVRIGTLIATPLNSLVVLEDGPIKSIADLKGGKIGYSVGGVEEAMLTVMLGKYGLTLADVELVNVNFSLSPALIAGHVDAVIGAYRNFELNQMDIEGRPGRAFYVEEEGIPGNDELIFVAHKERLDRPALRDFIHAIERGAQYMVNHPQASWELFKAVDSSLDNELNRRAWRDTLPRFALRPAALDRGRYRRFAAFLHEQGIIESVPPLDSYAVELQ